MVLLLLLLPRPSSRPVPVRRHQCYRNNRQLRPLDSTRRLRTLDPSKPLYLLYLFSVSVVNREQYTVHYPKKSRVTHLVIEREGGNIIIILSTMNNSSSRKKSHDLNTTTTTTDYSSSKKRKLLLLSVRVVTSLAKDTTPLIEIIIKREDSNCCLS